MDSKALPRKPNVLAVDDKHANRIALEAVLGDDYNVIHADSGAKAIARMEVEPRIDVVLMDVQMPGMDGFEAASRIKEMNGCEDIPIIFVTAVHDDHLYVRKGYDVGGIDYFSKPFDPEILKRKVAIYSSFRLKTDLLRERERHIRETEELLRVGRKLSRVLESLPVGVLIADSEGIICQTTEEVARILKVVEPAENDSYGEIMRWWDDSGKVLRREDGPLAQALRGKVSHSERLDIRCCDGSEETILTSASPLRRLDGRIAGAVVLIQDVTESERIAEDLEEHVAKLVGLGVELEKVARPS